VYPRHQRQISKSLRTGLTNGVVSKATDRAGWIAHPIFPAQGLAYMVRMPCDYRQDVNSTAKWGIVLKSLLNPQRQDWPGKGAFPAGPPALSASILCLPLPSLPIITLPIVAGFQRGSAIKIPTVPCRQPMLSRI
jgi:hypothetical protein